MTSTVEIMEELLNEENSKLEIMKLLRGGKELTRTEILEDLNMISEEVLETAIEYLDKTALIDNVFVKKRGSFYRLSARGKSILVITGMIKDERE